MPIGEDFLNVRAYLTTHLRTGCEEGIIGWRTSVSVETQNYTCEMCVVRLGTAELIVGNCRSKTSFCWPRRQVLQLTASSHIPYEDIEFAITPEGKDTAVVITTRGLSFITLTRRYRRSIMLERAQFDQIESKSQSLAIPNEAINAIAQ